MSERLPQPELTEQQEISLQLACNRYGVEYSPDHYFVFPSDSFMMAGWAQGWLGGMTHANPEYREPDEPAAKPTIYVGVSPEGEVNS